MRTRGQIAQPRGARETRPALGVTVAIVAIAAGFFAPMLFFERMPLFRDFINTFLPYKLYSARAFAAGRIPLWAPEPSFGAPLLANYQSGVLYPPAALAYLWPSPVGIGLYLAFHFAVGGLGIAALLARRGLSPGARLLGAVVFVLGGVFISISMWSHLAVAAWMPLAIVAAERLVEAPSAPRFLALVAVLALQVYGGAPETFAQSSVLALAAALVAPGGMPLGRRLASVGAAGVLALGLGAPQLCPTAEHFLQTTRALALPPDQAMKDSLDPATALTLLVPHRLDGGAVAVISEHAIPLFWSVYVGLLPLALVVVALPGRRGRWWALALAGAVGMALGDHTPLFPLLYRALPRLFGAFRYPQKFLVTAHLAVAVLAALGAGEVERRVARGGRLSPALLLAGFSLVTVADLVDVHFPAMLYSDWPSLVASAPPAVLGRPGPADRIFHYSPTGSGLEPWYPKFGVRRDLEALERTLWSDLTANVSLVYGVGFVNGADSMVTLGMRDFYKALDQAPTERAIELLRAFGVRWLIGSGPVESPALEPARRGGAGTTWIYRVRDPGPRAYLARRVRPAADVAAALALISDGSFAVGGDAIVLDGPAEVLAGGRANLVEDGPERVALAVESDGAGFLVVSDTLLPGWRAAVDGASVPIVRTNGLVRGVAVPPGRHRVTFEYAPASFRIGLAVALAAALAAAPAAGWIGRSASRSGRRLEL